MDFTFIGKKINNKSKSKPCPRTVAEAQRIVDSGSGIFNKDDVRVVLAPVLVGSIQAAISGIAAGAVASAEEAGTLGRRVGEALLEKTGGDAAAVLELMVLSESGAFEDVCAAMPALAGRYAALYPENSRIMQKRAALGGCSADRGETNSDPEHHYARWVVLACCEGSAEGVYIRISERGHRDPVAPQG